jgi:predicted DNA-binding transcriptional regulator YafY
MRLHRLIAILLLIESRGRMTAKELAEALETSVRSIYRDMDTLAEAGIPIVATSGPGGGIELMQGYTVNLKQLNGDEVIHLYLTGMGIHSGGHTESGLKLKSALLKLEKTLPAAYQADIQKVKARFYFDDTPWWEERLVLPCLEELRRAVWRQVKLAVSYRKADGSRSERRLRPYGLVVKMEEWYLAAYCEDAGAVRTFKCERILKAEALEEEFMIPEDFSLEEYWSKQELSFKVACREQEFYPVQLRLAKRHRQALSSLEVMDCADGGEFLSATVNLYGYEAACRTALEMIARVEVIAPAELRLFVKQTLADIQQAYE